MKKNLPIIFLLASALLVLLFIVLAPSITHPFSQQSSDTPVAGISVPPTSARIRSPQQLIEDRARLARDRALGIVPDEKDTPVKSKAKPTAQQTPHLQYSDGSPVLSIKSDKGTKLWLARGGTVVAIYLDPAPNVPGQEVMDSVASLIKARKLPPNVQVIATRKRQNGQLFPRTSEWPIAIIQGPGGQIITHGISNLQKVPELAKKVSQ